ncbi:hypothetical protein ACF1CY_004215 [Providencia rettgeri]
MKERGIIFNTEMVRAILDGRKTQTRRVMKPQPVPINDGANHVWYCDKIKADLDVKDALQDGIVGWYGLISSVCPFGGVGDRLWVRETFALLGNEDGVCVDWNDNILKAGEEQAARIYKASCEQKDGDYGLWSIPDDADWKPHTDNHKYEGTWRPSIHMPRWASRITLEITNVRVERLQSISEEDAKAEGFDNSQSDAANSIGWFEKPIRAFRRAWENIYGTEGWDSNPWVWVIEFKRV